MTKIKSTFRLLKDAFKGWSQDQSPTLAGALAYFTMFSIAPLLIIAIAISGLVFGEEASRGEIFGSIQGLLGPQGASSIQSMVQGAASQKHVGVIATIVGVVTLILGASGVFKQLQTSLNMIWKVTPREDRGIWNAIRQNLLSFSMVAVLGFILMVSLVLSAGLSAVGKYLGGRLPGGQLPWEIVNFAVSLGVVSALFASIFKILPDVKIPWKDAFEGGIFTAIFFTIGKTLFGLYLGKSSVASSYGAAGSLIIVLLWVYFSASVLFYGAELTRMIAKRRHRKIEPKEGARLIALTPFGAPLESPDAAQVGKTKAA